MVTEIAPVNFHGSRFPVPHVAVEHFLGHSFEEPVFWQSRHFVIAPDRGKECRCAFPRFVEADAAGHADGFPDAPSLVLAVGEEAFAAGRR